MERGVLIGAAGLRWAAWIWLLIVALVNLRHDHATGLAVAAIAVTGAVTVAASVPLARGPWRSALDARLVGAEVAAALFILLADGWVDQGRDVGQTLSGSWPIPVILVAALAGGLLWGAATAIALGAARSAAVLISGWDPGQEGRALLSAVSTSIEWIAFGVMAAVVIRLLHRAEGQIAEAGDRERIARHLHDGVLQTLALIERRSDSPEVCRLAREQEQDLRAFLFGDDRRSGALAAELRGCARRFERSWPTVNVTVSVSDDVAALTGPPVTAAAGAVSEALTNSAKHGGATTVVVFGDVEDATGDLFVSIKDNGSGFELGRVSEGVGMAESIRGRVEAAGGRCQFASDVGLGTEVRLWVPLP
jgi:signal transduction histidine kinase